LNSTIGSSGIQVNIPPLPSLIVSKLHVGCKTFIDIFNISYLITRKDARDAKTEGVINLSKGVCTRAEKESYHTVYSITEMTLVAMLTKRWDKSTTPIIRIDD
jgi:hypothetical protein